ncbi:MAG: hypothetical protein II563_07535, partial [Treponema sp.]|nr:hypothetical protein [Treponema sp.]
EYLAYNSTPIERQRRVEIVRSEIVASLNESQIDFVNFVLQQYVQQGYTELSLENLPDLIKLKYGTTKDARAVLGDIPEIRNIFIGFQKDLYAA